MTKPHCPHPHAALKKIILDENIFIIAENIKYGDDIFFILDENNLFLRNFRTCRAQLQEKNLPYEVKSVKNRLKKITFYIVIK